MSGAPAPTGPGVDRSPPLHVRAADGARRLSATVVRPGGRAAILRWWRSRTWWTGTAFVLSAGFGAFAGALIGRVSWEWSVVGIVCAVALLIIASIRVRGIDRAAGTVYYVSAQFSGSSNWHEDALEELRKGRRDLRVVKRTLHGSAECGVLDLTDELTEMARALEAAENTDNTDSGFHLAPDVLWPVGLALGSTMHGSWPNQTLHELPTDRPGREERARLNDPAHHSAEPAPDHPVGPELSWSLHATEKASISQEKLAPHWSSLASLSTARAEGSDPRLAGYVLVTVQLTNDPSLPSGSPKLRPPELRGIDWYGVASFVDPEPMWTTALRKVRMGRRPAEGGSAASSTDVFVHPYPATSLVVTAVRRALREGGDRLVVLTMQVPKTVSLAIGWHLVHDRLLARPHDMQCVDGIPGFIRRDLATKTPWKRLILLSFDPVTSGYYATRVHPDQPDVTRQRQAMRDLGFLP